MTLSCTAGTMNCVALSAVDKIRRCWCDYGTLERQNKTSPTRQRSARTPHIIDSTEAKNKWYKSTSNLEIDGCERECHKSSGKIKTFLSWTHFSREMSELFLLLFRTFTFMHLADAFIQSDLHCIQVTVLHFISSCFPWESNPWSWRC